MDNKKLNLLFQVMSICEQFSGYKIDEDLEYINDADVLDCRFKLYVTLLVDSDGEAEKRFEEFKESYLKLSREKQEYISEHLRKIFEEQDKNNKEKEKIL